jgi:hypothetical protein
MRRSRVRQVIVDLPPHAIELRQMIFGKRTERHQARNAEGREEVDLT